MIVYDSNCRYIFASELRKSKRQQTLKLIIMKTFRINTTGWKEEDFFITSNLTKQEIIDVIKPIVMNERNNDVDYNNQDLYIALIKKYPNREIQIAYDFQKIEI